MKQNNVKEWNASKSSRIWSRLESIDDTITFHEFYFKRARERVIERKHII